MAADLDAERKALAGRLLVRAVQDLKDEIASELREWESRVRADEREACAKAAESAYPCSCDAAYKDRGLTAPDCFHCNPA